jgi:hypothetical protein
MSIIALSSEMAFTFMPNLWILIAVWGNFKELEEVLNYPVSCVCFDAVCTAIIYRFVMRRSHKAVPSNTQMTQSVITVSFRTPIKVG